MATRYLARSLLSLTSPLSHSCAAVIPNSSSYRLRLRPLVALASASYFRRLVPAISTRAFSSRQTSTSLSDPNPNWSNRPPKETILLDGCDFEHWLVVVEKPEGDPTRDEIIDSYIKTLATVVGSEAEARMKIYSVSTRHYYAFGALVSEELSYKLKELPNVRWVLPDSYLDVKNKDYGGEPFINGQAVPYDPKYHEEWVRNNARANERNRRNDRPRNFDRSRNFERRREAQSQNYGGPGGGPGGNYGGPGGGPGGNYGGPGGPGGGSGGNYGGQAPPPPNAPNPGTNMGGQSTYGSGAPPNYPSTGGGSGGNYGGQAPPPNAPNPGTNMGGQSTYGSGAPPNYPSNNTRPPPNNAYGPGPNSGGAPYQSGPGPDQSGFPSPGQGHNQNYPGGPGQVGGNFGPNAGYGQNNFGQGQYQNAYPPNVGGGNHPQSQNIPGRDFPPSAN